MELKKAVDLTELAIGIMILGIVVSIGATVLLNVRNNRLTELDVVQTGNESLTGVTETGSALSNVWVKSVDSCLNATGNEEITSTNYTLSISSLDGTGTISVSDPNSVYNNTDWKCTYNWYNTSRSDFALPNDAVTGIGEYGSWFKIIVIIGVAALVLALIFLTLGRGVSSGESTSEGSY